MGDINNSGISRPEAADKALPLCYGDLIMLSCTIGKDGIAYLCEKGCVLKDADVEMKVSSRELTFEICVAADTRVLQQINVLLRKNGIPMCENPTSQLNFQFSPTDSLLFERLLKKKETEDTAANIFAQQMQGRVVTYGDMIQLKHTKTQAFLAIDTSMAPKIEPVCKRIMLSSALNAFCRFRILPRFKYLSEGNTVCMGDNISLMSVDHVEEYLHTSVGFSREDVGIVYEVNLSRDRSALWTLESFISYKTKSEDCIKTGEVIRLYHSFCNSFVAALANDDRVLLEKSDESSSLSSTMWVVEDEKTTTGGPLKTLRSFTLMHLVTKRYLCISEDVLEPAFGSIGADLTEKQRANLFMEIKLEGSRSQAASLLLHSPDDNSISANVGWGDRFRIVNAATNQYLHATDAQGLAKYSTVNRRTKHHFLQKEAQAASRVLAASPALFREDSFEIVKVPEDQVKAVETLAKMLPVLREYRDSLEYAMNQTGTDFPNERVVEIMEQLESLASFVYTGSSESAVTGTMKEDSTLAPISFCQNFMRDLCVADLLMSIVRHVCNLVRKQKYFSLYRNSGPEDAVLAIPFMDLIQPESLLQVSKNRPAVLICERIYEALFHMVRKHKQNATYLAKFLDDIQEQLVLKIGAERLLLEILRENEILLCPEHHKGQSPFQKKHVKFHIDALVRDGKDPMHLAFLSSMVAIGDRGVEIHQDLVLPELARYKADIVLDIRIENQAVQLKDPKCKNEMQNHWIDLSIIATGAERQGDRGSALKRMLDYWQEYLLLLASLCKPGRTGRRDFLVRKIQSLVDCDICITCLQDDSLPNRLRWTVCELLRVAFVEQDDFLKISRFAGVAIWDDLDRAIDAEKKSTSTSDGIVRQNNSTLTSYKITHNQSIHLKKTLMDYFSKHMVHHYPPRAAYSNRLKMSMLRLCRHLVLFEHFQFTELEGVVKLSRSILDYSNLRIGDVEQELLKSGLQRDEGSGEMASKLTQISELSEQTITYALSQLRAIVGEFPPLEVARLQCTFAAYRFETGEIVVQQGHKQQHMFVIQSGNAFTVRMESDGVETVVGTLSPGQVFGADSLQDTRCEWPWQVRCSSRLLLLAISRSDFRNTLDRLKKNGQTKLTDGLVSVFNMQREACLMINDIYDLRLQARARKLLQEYRFDYNISNRRYCLAQSLEQKSSIMLRFPRADETKNEEVGAYFMLGSHPVFGALKMYIAPWRRCFCGLLRIDHAVITIAMVQITLSILIIILLLISLLTQSVQSFHPGPSKMDSAVINLVMTISWSIANIWEIWGAFALHKLTVNSCTGFQLVYLLFFVANTSAGLAEGALQLDDKTSVYGQAMWLSILSPFGLYSALAFASLAAKVEDRTFFSKFNVRHQLPSDTQSEKLIPYKFMKALEFFDLDEDGSFSRILTDLFVSKYQSLVVDAFCLLVRTHDSVSELHQQLFHTLLLTNEDTGNPEKLYSTSHSLTLRLLDATNALQAYNVDNSCKSTVDSAKEVLQDILDLIADKAPIVQRHLLQKQGLHRVVIRLLTSLREDHIQVEGALCYSILAALCDDDKDIKRDCEEHMDIFMHHFEFLPRIVVMFLSSLFVNNAEACENVNEALVERIVSMIESDLDECYLVFLRIVAAPVEQSSPLRRNQNLIMKLLGSDMTSGLQIKQLASSCLKGTTTQKGQNRNLYLALLDLLAVCMAENNIDAKTRCRGGNIHLTLELNEIETQLKDRLVPSSVKASLLKFLEEAYIKVEFTARYYLLQPELLRIFDHYSRYVEKLPSDDTGDKIALLRSSERELLLVRYLSAIHSYLSLMSAPTFNNPNAPHTRVAYHLLESLGALLLTGPAEVHRPKCSPEEELRILQVVRNLYEKLEFHDNKRFQALEKNIISMLGSKEPNDRGQYQREIELRQDIVEETDSREKKSLNVTCGVQAFADEFLQQMAEHSNEQVGAKPVSPKLLESLRQLKHSTSASNDEVAEIPYSDMCMESLVDLMHAAVTTPKFLPIKLCMTGLYILLSVVQSVSLISSDHGAIEDSSDRRRWFDLGIPGVIIDGLSAPGVLDAVGYECLCIGIELLERGGLSQQESFHKLLQGRKGPAFFGALRDRLLRAERGLTTIQSLFWSKAKELAIVCEAQGRLLTIAGVEEICNEHRSSKTFVGSHSKYVLRLLQLFCEGHNRRMQDYVRHQGTNSADLVASCAEFLVSTSRQMHPICAPLVLQCLDTLIEFVQSPCPGNQRSLVDSQLPYVLNSLLQTSIELPDGTIIFEDLQLFQILTEQIKTKTVTFLLSLLERVDGPFIPSRILEALEIDNIIRDINHLKKLYSPFCVEEDGNFVASAELSANGSFKVACSLFMLLQILKHYDTDNHHNLAGKCCKAVILDMPRLRANCGFVEISRDGQLERIFFQIPAVCRFLTSEARGNIKLSSAETSNHQDRMLYFVRQAQARYEEMVHLQSLRDFFLYRIYRTISYALGKFFFLNALVLNLLCIGGYRYPDLKWDTFLSMNSIVIPNSWKWSLVCLSIVQLILSLIRFAGYYVDQGILEVRRKFNTDQYIHVYAELYGGPRFYNLFVYFLLLDPEILILSSFVVSNVLALALFTWSPLSFLFLGIHLLDMVHHSTAIADVLKAVSSRANTLLQTGGLAFIMMYVYSAIGFLSFPESFLFDNPDAANGSRSPYNLNGARCDTLWKCFLVTVDMGLRKGDIGGALDDIQWRDLLPGTSQARCDGIPGLEWLGCVGTGGEDTGSFIYFRVAYTSLFFVFVHTIIINILFGVIIDRFGELREQNEKFELEMENTCFVCGLNRYIFEVASADGKGFERHTKEDHNMWQYLFFIIHLYLKAIDEHTGWMQWVVFGSKRVLMSAGFRTGTQLVIDEFVSCIRAQTLSCELTFMDAAPGIQNSKEGGHDFKVAAQVDKLYQESISRAEDILARLQTAGMALERSRAMQGQILQKTADESEWTQTTDSEDSEASGPDDEGFNAGPLRLFSLRNVQPSAAVLGVSEQLAATAVNVQEGMMEAAHLFASLAGIEPRRQLLSLGEPRTGSVAVGDPDDTSNYDAQLSRLAAEGFDNDALNRELLVKHRGDYQKVLRELLS